MIQYRFARTENGEQVDIYSLEKKQGKYYCIGCGNEMIAHFWDNVGHHFQHKANYSCSTETYLHKLGKKVFFDTFIKCQNTKETFYIESSQIIRCHYYKDIFNEPCSQEINRKINLLDYFTDISVEEKEGEFIPDIRLYNRETKEQVFIEIKVTHESTYKKIKAGNRIIEIFINNEKDISYIQNRYIIETPGKINFFNFKKEIRGNCNGDCKDVHYFLWLNSYGKASMEDKNIKQIKEIIKKKSNNIVKYQINNKNYRYMYNIYKNFVMECIKDGFVVKTCIICKYVDLYPWQIYEDYIYRMRGKSGLYVRCSIPLNEDKEKHCNYAVICPDFTLDSEQFE
jgi:hypothetical protein